MAGRSRTRGPNNNYSLEVIMFNNNNNNNNNNNYLHLGTHRSHQCQGFHATPANTPTLWGGSSSSTKFPNDSSRPPTPSFPPYDVRTLHFVACGRPWLLFRAPRPTTTACAREEKTNVSRMVLFDRDDGPGRCATVVAEVRKSCSQKPV